MWESDGSFHTFLLTFTLGGLDTDFLVVLLESGEILTGLGELTLFHTFTDVPVDEGTLGVHKIELVVNAGEDLSDGSGVGDHADGAHNLGEITTGNNSWGLVVDTALEASGAPVDELDGSLGLDGGNGGVDILWDDITSVHEAACHVLSVSGVTLGHHSCGLEGRVGDLSNRELFMIGLLSRDNWSIRRKHEMDSGVRYEVGLEFSDINVKGTIESEGSSQRGDDLSDESVKVGVGGSLDIKVSSGNIIDGFVIKDDGDIGVLKKRVSGEDGVVRFNNGGGDLRRRIDGETKLGLLTVINRESFEEEGSETGTGSTTDGVEDEETLETSALIGKLSDSIEAEIDNFLTNGVVTTGEVVGGIFFTRDELLGMEQLSVGTSSNFIDDGWLEIEEDSSWDVLTGTSLREEGVEGIITTTDGLIGRHLTIRLDSVLKAEEFPTGVTNLDTGLTAMDRNNLSHLILCVFLKKVKINYNN